MRSETKTQTDPLRDIAFIMLYVVFALLLNHLIKRVSVNYVINIKSNAHRCLVIISHM